MTQHTDEECIAIAAIHGARFFYADGRLEDKLWHLEPKNKWHPIERDRERETNGTCGWSTLGEIARAYCKYHNLLR